MQIVIDIPQPLKEAINIDAIPEENVAVARLLTNAVKNGIVIPENAIIEQLKSICEGKENTEKVEISVLRLNRIIKALESTKNDSNKSDDCD